MTGLTINPASPDNEAIRELRDSSKRLEISTERLSKSSERLEKLTYILISVTFFIGLLTIILIFPDLPTKQKDFLVVLAFIMLIIVLFHKKLLRIFKK